MAWTSPKRAYVRVLRRPSRALQLLFLAGAAALSLLTTLWRRRPGEPGACIHQLLDVGLRYDEFGDDNLHTRHTLQRKHIYDNIEEGLKAHGLNLLAPVTQGLSLTDLFQMNEGHVTPNLQKLDIPVRALVAPILDAATIERLHAVYSTNIEAYSPPGGSWPQDPNVYHTTVWHASAHQHPVPLSSPEEVQDEILAVQKAVAPLCPIHLVLERVVVSSTGVFMACWQVLGGTEPETLRSALRAALPRAPPLDKQTVRAPAIWYTTLGRLLVPVHEGGRWYSRRLKASSQTAVLQELAQKLTSGLCGLQAVVDRIWYVEEFEKLALALSGNWHKEEALLQGEDCTVSVGRNDE